MGYICLCVQLSPRTCELAGALLLRAVLTSTAALAVAGVAIHASSSNLEEDMLV
jgi:hypothetical protein